MVVSFSNRLRVETRLEGEIFSGGKPSSRIIWFNDDDDELVDAFQTGLYAEFEQSRILPASSVCNSKA